MFKRKCHEVGDAIRVVAGLVIICNCITAQELKMLFELAKENDNV